MSELVEDGLGVLLGLVGGVGVVEVRLVAADDVAGVALVCGVGGVHGDCCWGFENGVCLLCC